MDQLAEVADRGSESSSDAGAPAVDDAEEVRDGIGGQPRSDRRRDVESVVCIGEFGVGHRGGAGRAQCGAECAGLAAGHQFILLAVQHEERRRVGRAHTKSAKPP